MSYQIILIAPELGDNVIVKETLLAHMVNRDSMLHNSAIQSSRQLALGLANASGAGITSEDAISKAIYSVSGVKDEDVQQNLAEMLLGRHIQKGQNMVRLMSII